MIFLLLTVPVFMYFSTIAFNSMNLTVMNYESKQVPYNLGVVVLYSYAVLYFFPPQELEAFSVAAFIYIFGVWLLGMIDDLFGTPYPKGLKGHFFYSIKNKTVTTGLLKAVGTIILTFVYLSFTQIHLLSFLLLIGLPHVMNLFDTRPLRVWKVTLCMAIIIMIVSSLPSVLFMTTLLVVFYIFFVFEGTQKAMLGDNGATAVGAIMAVVLINETGVSIQMGALFIVIFLVILTERFSLSSLIERFFILKRIDQVGQRK